MLETTRESICYIHRSLTKSGEILHLTIKKLLALLSIIILVVVLQACDDSSSSTGGDGGTFEVLDLTEDQSAEGEDAVTDNTVAVTDTDAKPNGNEPKATTASAAPAIQAAAIKKEPRGDFHILIDQSHMACVECGLNFDSAELIIDHSAGRFTARQSGSLHIKKGPYRQGRFRANIRSIPPDAEIYNATLHMRLNQDEGIASSDRSSEFVVKGYVDGNLIHVKDFSIQHDIKGKGYSKGLNPVVPFDYTSYARKL